MKNCYQRIEYLGYYEIIGGIFGISLVFLSVYDKLNSDGFFIFSLLLFVTLCGISMGWPIDKPGIFYLPSIQEWIYYYPNVAGARAIMIGIGLGIFATSIRYILGIEKSYIGE